MQVPRHEYRVVEDAGCQKVVIDVHLTGVTDTSSVVVTIDPPDIVTVLVPDRYHLQLTLPVPISPHAESVRFKRRTGKLAMLCTVDSTTEGPAAAAAAAASPAAGHDLLGSDAAAAEPTQPAAADSMQEQERADAAKSGTGRRQQQQQQQQHADQAAVSKPDRQGQAREQSQKAKALNRRGVKVADQGDALQVADTLHKAGQLDPLGHPSAQDKQLPGSLAVPQQQQRQQQQPGVPRPGAQQQAVMSDSDMGEGRWLKLSRTAARCNRKHAPTLVGYWCAAWAALTLAALQWCQDLWNVAVLLKETKWVPFGPYGNAALDAVAWLAFCLAILSALPTLLWQGAWLLPLLWLAAFRVTWWPEVYDSDGSSREDRAAISVELTAMGNKLQDNDSLAAGLTKLLLAGVTAVVVWALVRVTCVWQLGSHSLGGWVLAVVLLPCWDVVVWLWRQLLWRPLAGYPVQLLFGGLYSLSGATLAKRTRCCRKALALLQIVITGGGWPMLYSFALSVLWHMGACWDINWRDRDACAAAQRPAGKAAGKEGTAHQLPPWWPAAAAGMFPAIVRSWLLLLSHFAEPQAALSAAGAGVEAAVVLLAGGLGGTLSLMQAGLQLLSAACRHSLANVLPGPLKILAGSLLGALAARGAGLASRVGWWWVQRAAGAVMGVLGWAAPAWYVGPLVQRACAASGVWQEGCLELLQPYAAQAPDSLSLSHSWWFTILIYVWMGCMFRQLVACEGGKAGGRWLQEERQQRQRQKKELKWMARKLQKKVAVPVTVRF